jgi:hypothetical protein
MKDEMPLLFLIIRLSSFLLSLGGDEGSRTLIDRFTRPTLWYPIELHRLIPLPIADFRLPIGRMKAEG